MATHVVLDSNLGHRVTGALSASAAAAEASRLNAKVGRAGRFVVALPQPHRGEFALTLPTRLRALPYAHRCHRCGRGSARFFTCTPCGDLPSVTVESLARFQNAAVSL